MAKKNIDMAFDEAYVRTRKDEGGNEYYLVSESAMATISWNCQSLEEDGIILTQNEEDENIWTISDGKDIKTIKVEKQIHQKVGRTWMICGEKLSDGTTIKLNGTSKGDYEVWTNQNFNAKGKRTWKRVSISKSEAQGKKNWKKAIKEYKATIETKDVEAEVAEA